jgi:hypothetical protein
MIGEFDLTNVNPANFSMNVCIQSFFATSSSNDATSGAGRSAIIAYMSSFITSTLGGTIINTNITYVAPLLNITIIGTGNYNSTYSSASFEVDGLNYNGNVIMLQPQ